MVTALKLYHRVPLERCGDSSGAFISIDGRGVFNDSDLNYSRLWCASDGQLVFESIKTSGNTDEASGHIAIAKTFELRNGISELLSFAKCLSFRELQKGLSRALVCHKFGWAYGQKNQALDLPASKKFKVISKLQFSWSLNGKRLLVREPEQFEPRGWILEASTGQDLASISDGRLSRSSQEPASQETEWYVPCRDGNPTDIFRIENEEIQPIREFSGATARAFALRRDQNELIVGFEDGTVSLLRNGVSDLVSSGLSLPRSISSIHPLSDDRCLVESDGLCFLVDLGYVPEILGSFDGILGDISPDGLLAAIIGKNEFRVIDIRNAETLWSLERSFGDAWFSGGDGSVICRDSVGTFRGFPTYEFEMQSGLPLEHGFDYRALNIFRHRDLLAIGRRGFIKLPPSVEICDDYKLLVGGFEYPRQTKPQLETLQDDGSVDQLSGQVLGADCSSDRRLVACVWKEGYWGGGAQKVLFVNSGNQRSEMDLVDAHESAKAYSVSFSPDGDFLLIVDETGKVRCLDASVGSTAWIRDFIPSDVKPSILATSRDGNVNLFVDSRPRVINVLKERSHTLHVNRNEIIASEFSRDGSRLLVLDAQNRLMGFIPCDGNLDQPDIDLSSVVKFRFSCSGRRFVTFHDDGELNLWESETGSQLASVSTGHRKINACGIDEDEETIRIVVNGHVETYGTHLTMLERSVACKVPFTPNVDGWPLRFIHDVVEYFKLDKIENPLFELSANESAKAGMRRTENVLSLPIKGQTAIPNGELRKIHLRFTTDLREIRSVLAHHDGLPFWSRQSEALKSHDQADIVYKFEITDFGLAFNCARVIGWLEKGPLMMGRDAAIFLARLLTRSDHLPMVSRAMFELGELISFELSKRLFQQAAKYGAHFSRYGPSLYISAASRLPIEERLVGVQGEHVIAGTLLSRLVAQSGLRLNPLGKALVNGPVRESEFCAK